MPNVKHALLAMLLMIVLFAVVVINPVDVNATEPMYAYGSADSCVAKTLNPIWNYASKKGAKWFEFGPAGNIIVAEKKSIYALNPVDGTQIWKLEKTEEISRDRFEIIEGTNYVMLCTKKGLTGKGKESSLLLNTVTGDTVWNSSNDGIKQTYGQFYIPKLNYLLIFGNPDGKTVLALNLNTFEVEWTNSSFLEDVKLELFKVIKEVKVDQSLAGGTRLVFKHGRKSIKGHHGPIWISDTSMLLMINRIGPFTFNPLTGQRNWSAYAKTKKNGSGKKLKETPSAYLGYSQPVYDAINDVILLAYGQYLGAFSPIDGTRIWETPKYNVIVSKIQLAEDVAVVSAGQYYGLDYKTGAEHWTDKLPYPKQKSLKRSPTMIYYKESTSRMYVMAGQLDKTILERSRYSFDEMDDGYIIYSKQHVIRFDAVGNTLQHVYSGYGDRGSFAKAFRGTYYYQDYQGGTTGYYTDVISDDFVFMPVKTLVKDKKYGVAVISKKTGQPTCQIALGGKAEKYRIDGNRHRLIASDKKRKIFTCYSFGSVE